MPKTIDIDGRQKSSQPYLLSYLSNFLSTLLVVPVRICITYNIAQILFFLFIIFYDVENVTKIRKICRIVQNMVFYISCEVYLMLFNGVSKKIHQ